MQIPKPLVDDIAQKRCLPFIGAGFSLNAELSIGKTMPTWTELGTALANVAGCRPSLDAPDIATLYEHRFGRVQLIEAIRDALHPNDVRPGAAHKAFAQLPFDTVYTTNFDLLLEDTFAESRKPFQALAGELQMPFHGGVLTTNIVKMHGDVRHAEYLIATRSDYDTYLEMYPVIATHLSAMLITRTALFIGYSRTDQDYLQIENIIRKRLGQFRRMPYIVQFNVSPDEVERRLEERQHVISLAVGVGKTRGEVLAEFFDAIQEQLDIMAGHDLREARPDVFEVLTEDILTQTYSAPDASSLLASSSTLCFVMMPMRTELDRVYWLAIKPAVEQVGLKALRADEITSPGPIVEQVRAAIQQSRLCIADLTGSNPNVLFEFGLAQAMGKRVILLARKGERLPFDVAGLRVLFYDTESLDETLQVLRATVEDLQGEANLAEAEQLIAKRMTREAVVRLSMVLENALRQMDGASESYSFHGTQTTRPVTLGRLVELLKRSGEISADEERDLRRFVDLRNRAVHKLEEPTMEDAQFALSIVRKYLRRNR